MAGANAGQKASSRQSYWETNERRAGSILLKLWDYVADTVGSWCQQRTEAIPITSRGRARRKLSKKEQTEMTNSACAGLSLSPRSFSSVGGFRLSPRGLQIEPTGPSKLDQVLVLSLRLLLPPSVSSNVLRSTTFSGETRWSKFANSALAKNGLRELRNNR